MTTIVVAALWMTPLSCLWCWFWKFTFDTCWVLLFHRRGYLFTQHPQKCASFKAKCWRRIKVLICMLLLLIAACCLWAVRGTLPSSAATTSFSASKPSQSLFAEQTAGRAESSSQCLPTKPSITRQNQPAQSHSRGLSETSTRLCSYMSVCETRLCLLMGFHAPSSTELVTGSQTC